MQESVNAISVERKWNRIAQWALRQVDGGATQWLRKVGFESVERGASAANWVR